jgi:hypothetical protein
MTSIIPEFDIEASDVEHIKRLRKLREAGDDMETTEELEASLLARFGNPEATETFEWATDGPKVALYSSGVWTRDGILNGDYPNTVLEFPESE